MKRDPQSFEALLHTLNWEQLGRVERALVHAEAIAEPGCTVDLIAIVEAAKALPTSGLGNAEWRGKIDGGRRYELLLEGLSPEEIDRRYEEEWQQAEMLVKAGFTYQEAWDGIRRDSLLSNEDDRGAVFEISPVATPEPIVPRQSPEKER